MENQLQFKELLSKSLINPFGHPYVIIDKDMGILAVNGSPKAPVFTSPPQHGVDLDQILHPYIKGRCSNLLKQAIKGANQTTEFIQLTDGYFCRMQLLEVPSSENGQAFICFFETHNRKALPGTDVYLSKPISSWSNGHPKSDNIYHKVKCTEARLKENEQLLISINENLNEGIYRSTPKNGFIYVNKAFARMFGLTVEEAININPEKLYANESDRNRVTNTLVTKGHLKNEQVEFLKRDGTTFWGFLSSIRTKDANGQLIFDGAIVDISDLKRSKVLLHEKNDELKKINAELDRFVYSASHDLRAPLTSLLGLYIVKETVEKLQGTVQVQSVPGKGTTFILRIPNLEVN